MSVVSARIFAPLPLDDWTVIVGSASYPSPPSDKNTSLIDDASESVAKVSCSSN
jgi:hypothetical protein